MLRDRSERGWSPMLRLATPTDVGDAAALLCSEQAGSIAGQSLAVDGGASPACPDLPLDLQRR
ncbi:SDR family oxidoreductase [Roseiarcus sp.]|uniref:SDR family oxidoreductase n=1 Tax=Roseiarcus sp. TaxID=1969460 RepID=UPI003F990A29